MTQMTMVCDPNKMAAATAYDPYDMAPAFLPEIARQLAHEKNDTDRQFAYGQGDTAAQFAYGQGDISTQLARGEGASAAQFAHGQTKTVAKVAKTVSPPEKISSVNTNSYDSVAKVAKVAGVKAKNEKMSKEDLPLRKTPRGHGRYPVEELGPFAEAVADLCRVIKVPQAMAGSSVLTALAFCAQGIANVHMHDGRIVPLALNCLTVGDSGDRKTAVDSVVSQRINDIEMEEQMRYQREMRDYLQAKEAYEQCSKKEQELFSFDEKAPRDPLMRMENLTIEGLFRALKEGRPSLAVFSDEGGTLFGGPAFHKENALKSITFFSKLWDGSPVDKARSGEGFSRLYNRRVSMHLMIQPSIAKDVFSNEVFQNQGFLPRFLISWPLSLKGTRTYENYNIRQSVHVQKLYRRCEELLHIPLQIDELSGSLSFAQIYIDDKAHALWIANHDNIESQISSEGALSPISAYASKSAEQAIRIAGVLTLAKDPQSRIIEYDTMKNAIILSRWYLGETLRIVEDEGTPAHVLRAEQLLRWLDEKNITRFSVRLILRRGPNALRQKKLVDEAIATLEEYQQISRGIGKELIDGRETRTFWERTASLSDE